MALAFTNKIDGAIRTYIAAEGLVVAHIEMTALAADYGAGAGYDLTANAAKMGFRKIFAVSGVSAKNGAGAALVLMWWTWDFVGGKLRAANATSEANAAALLTDGTKVRFIVMGV
jgi:hypothetical protein